MYKSYFLTYICLKLKHNIRLKEVKNLEGIITSQRLCAMFYLIISLINRKPLPPWTEHFFQQL